jgi:hypothetical protein
LVAEAGFELLRVETFLARDNIYILRTVGDPVFRSFGRSFLREFGSREVDLTSSMSTR